jgi:hypothetical protein
MTYVLKQMSFSVNDENAIALKYFDFRTSPVWQFWNTALNSFRRPQAVCAVNIENLSPV